MALPRVFASVVPDLPKYSPGSAAAPGEALAGLGETIGGIGEHFQKLQQTTEVNRAVNEATLEMADAFNSARSDPKSPYTTLVDRTEEAVNRIREKYVYGASDPEVAHALEDRLGSEATSTVLKAMDAQRGIAISDAQASANDRLDQLVNQGARETGSELDRTLSEMRSVVDGAVASGSLYPDDGQRIIAGKIKALQVGRVQFEINSSPESELHSLLARLYDPNQYPGIDEIERQQLVNATVSEMRSRQAGRASAQMQLEKDYLDQRTIALEDLRVRAWNTARGKDNLTAGEVQGFARQWNRDYPSSPFSGPEVIETLAILEGKPSGMQEDMNQRDAQARRIVGGLRDLLGGPMAILNMDKGSILAEADQRYTALSSSYDGNLDPIRAAYEVYDQYGPQLLQAEFRSVQAERSRLRYATMPELQRAIADGQVGKEEARVLFGQIVDLDQRQARVDSLVASQAQRSTAAAQADSIQNARRGRR